MGNYLGRRIQKIVENWNGSAYAAAVNQKFVYDGWNLIAEYAAQTSFTLARVYTWGIDLSRSLSGAGGVGGLLLITDWSTGQSYQPIYDGNGNVQGLLQRSNQSIAAQYDYAPFGETVRSTGTYALVNPFGFSTKFTDTETCLLDYGRRYYSLSQGRFLGRDPIDEKGGLLLYGFVENNPINRWDVLGMQSPTVMSSFTVNGGRREIKQELDGEGNLWEVTYQDMSIDPAYGIEDMQEVARVRIATARNSDPVDAPDPCAGRRTTNGNSTSGSSGSTRMWGFVRGVGGVLEAVAGAGFGAATSWTGAGAVAGGLVAAHGIDQAMTGFRQMFTGTQATSLTSQGLQAAGMSANTANTVDAGISVVGSMGAGSLSASTRIAQIRAADPLAASMSNWQLLRAYDQGSRALTNADYIALGGASTTPLAKAQMMAQGVNAAGEPYVVATNLAQQTATSVRLAGTGLTPSAQATAGAIGAAAAGAAATADDPCR